MSTYQEAVEKTIVASEQIHQIINGTATTEITVEDGSKVPSIRKALIDNFYFKDPILWQVGQTESVFNQLRQFTDGSWWYAPTATAINIVSMGNTPIGDPLWKIYTIDAVGKLAPQIREALRRSYDEAGYNLVSGSFEDGGVLALANDVLIQESTGKAYSGTIGIVVAGTNPLGGGFVDRSFELLSLNLNKPDGASKVGFQQAGSGSVARTSQDKMRDSRSAPDYGAVGNGSSDDTSAFAAMGVLSADKPIDGLGKTYLVTTIPTGGIFFNGMWKVGSTLTPFEYVGVIRAGNNVIAIGPNAAPGSISDDFIAIGRDAGAAAIEARNCIAIGKGAMLSNRYGRHNIAIGLESMRYLNGLSSSSFEGSRNIGIGGNAGRFMTTGNRNILLGRDVAHGLVDGTNNIVLGNGAMMGDGPNSLDPGVIINQTPLSGSRNVQIGTESGKHFNGGDAVLLGYQSGLNVVDATGIVGIGSSAFMNFQSDKSYWGTTQQLVNVVCSYAQTGGTSITINSPAHGLSTGYKVWLRFTTGDNAAVTFQDDIWFDVVVVDANSFTIQSPVSSVASGAALYTKIATNVTYTANSGESVGIGREVGNGTSNYRSVGIGDRVGAKGLGVENTGIGYQVFNLNTPGAGNVAVGAYSQQKVTATASGNVSVGVLTLNNLTVGTSNSAVGGQALRQLTTGTNNTGVGINAIRQATTASNNTGVGVDALRFTQSATDHNFNNCTGLGYQAYVSGDNQVQLGNSVTTTYVYGTVQNRSDARDKADLRPTELGDDFIDGLEAEEGFWDMREDYFEEHQVQIGIDEYAQPVFETRYKAIAKDGSKKRNRRHQWFVAQKLKTLCEELGVDFGGLQDHSINGGCDVLTIGYDEFIPPLTAYVQRRKKELRALEQVVSKQAGEISKQSDAIKLLTARLDKLEG